MCGIFKLDIGRKSSISVRALGMPNQPGADVHEETGGVRKVIGDKTIISGLPVNPMEASGITSVLSATHSPLKDSVEHSWNLDQGSLPGTYRLKEEG